MTRERPGARRPASGDREGAFAALAEGAGRILNRALTAQEWRRFGAYLDRLLLWQRTQRLVGSADPGWIVERLFLDSLLFRALLPSPCRRLLDLGAGAGFPGLPLQIVDPGTELILVEARRRRASFLSTVVRELGLDGVRVLNERAEAVAGDLAASCDAVVMRCAGDPTRLLGLALAFVRPGGVVVAGGPPDARPVAGVERVAVSGVRPGETRHLLVARRPA